MRNITLTPDEIEGLVRDARENPYSQRTNAQTQTPDAQTHKDTNAAKYRRNNNDSAKTEKKAEVGGMERDIGNDCWENLRNRDIYKLFDRFIKKDSNAKWEAVVSELRVLIDADPGTMSFILKVLAEEAQCEYLRIY